jgi:hypothetical protein
MEFTNFSRFKSTQPVVYDGLETMGVWRKPYFLTAELPSNLCGTYVVPSNMNGRPDLISNFLYKTTRYDWVLIAFNNVVDTLNWPPTGLQIKYPVKSVIVAGDNS